MALGRDRVVVAQAAKLLALVGSDEAGAHKLLRHNVLQAVTALVKAEDQVGGSSGFRVQGLDFKRLMMYALACKEHGCLYHIQTLHLRRQHAIV